MDSTSRSERPEETQLRSRGNIGGCLGRPHVVTAGRVKILTNPRTEPTSFIFRSEVQPARAKQCQIDFEARCGPESLCPVRAQADKFNQTHGSGTLGPSQMWCRELEKGFVLIVFLKQETPPFHLRS